MSSSASRFSSLVVALTLSLALAACGPQDTSPPAVSPGAASTARGGPTGAIAWRQGDVDDAFAEARASGRPVLLYWGAVWCPPCNQLKATLFKQADFIALTRNFVPVYLDGDLPDAQAWGEQFSIKGYPTLIVLSPDRRELTRLAGGSDTPALVGALQRAVSQRASVADVLQVALDSPASLDHDDWQALADYGWEVDANRLSGTASAEGVLGRLADAAPDEVLRRRFALRALPVPTDGPRSTPSEDTRPLLDALLASPDELYANRETLFYKGASLVQQASRDRSEAQRLGADLVAALEDAVDRSGQADSERLALTLTELQLHRQTHDGGPLPEALVEKARQRAGAAEAGAKTLYERQATISTAAYLLEQVGDAREAEALLLAELKRSHTPYYYMPALADLAEKRGDRAAAVDWLRQAYETSEGPATRVQWGVLYVDGLVRLRPDDNQAIEAAAAQVIAELDGKPQRYHQRTRQRFERLAATLAAWSKTHRQQDVLARLQARMAQNCNGQGAGAEGTACLHWLQG